MAAFADEDREAQRSLQLADGLADTRLTDAYALGSARNRALVGHRHQQPPIREIHAGSAPLFNADLPEEGLGRFRQKLFKRFDLLQDTLTTQDFLTGPDFSVADAYLFTVLGWCRFLSIDLAAWPALPAYLPRINARPAVETALHAEAA